MHRIFRPFFASLALFACMLAGPSFATERVHAFSAYIGHDFFRPLAAERCASTLTTADRGVVVPIPTPRPTQGADILTATDCSMTTASNGMLDKSGRRSETQDGSVGFVV